MSVGPQLLRRDFFQSAPRKRLPLLCGKQSPCRVQRSCRKSAGCGGAVAPDPQRKPDAGDGNARKPPPRLVAVPPGAYVESVCLFPHGGAEVRLSGLRWHDARREALTMFGRRDTHEAFICGGAPEVRQQIHRRRLRALRAVRAGDRCPVRSAHRPAGLLHRRRRPAVPGLLAKAVRQIKSVLPQGELYIDTSNIKHMEESQ